MPTYVYGCGCGNSFEQYGSLDAATAECPVCHNPAGRRPYSGMVYVKGATVTKAIPEEPYRWDAMRKEHRAKGWDEDRAVRFMRKGLREDANGNKTLDFQQAANASE